MSCVCQRAIRLPIGHRAFSTSAPVTHSLQLGLNDPELVAAAVPAYPHGSKQWYKQADLGLYGGQKVQFGNNTNEKYRTRTRQAWHPNVQSKRLFSKALGKYVQLRVTTRVLRTIDKVGGLDEYLLGEKEARIKELGESGWWLRWAIMQTDVVHARFAKQRAALLETKVSERQIRKQSRKSAAKAVTAIMKQVDRERDPDTIHRPEYGTRPSPQVRLDSKRLRFRTGKGKHVVLTRQGWKSKLALSIRLSSRLRRLEPLANVDRLENLTASHEERQVAFWNRVKEATRARWAARLEEAQAKAQDLMDRQSPSADHQQDEQGQATNQELNRAVQIQRRLERLAKKSEEKVDDMSRTYNSDWLRARFLAQQKSKAAKLRQVVKRAGKAL